MNKINLNVICRFDICFKNPNFLYTLLSNATVCLFIENKLRRNQIFKVIKYLHKYHQCIFDVYFGFNNTKGATKILKILYLLFVHI